MNHPLEAATDFGPAELVLLATAVIALAGAVFVVVRILKQPPEPAAQAKTATDEPDPREAAYVAANSKSPLVAFAAALLLGPIGYLYVSLTSGLILILLAVATYFYLPAGALFWWVIGVVAAPFEVLSHNNKVRATAALLGRRP